MDVDGDSSTANLRLQATYNVGEKGTSRIKELLSSSKPKEAIEKFQEETRLNVQDMDALYLMANSIDYERSSVDSGVFEIVKKMLLNKINTGELSSESHKQLLSATVHYLAIPELRAIPLALLKQRPSEIPDNIWTYLKENRDVYEMCSLEVKRVLWQTDITLFESHVTSLMEQYCNRNYKDYDMAGSDLGVYVQSRRRQQVLLDLGLAIGNSFRLYRHFIKIITSAFMRTRHEEYCALRLEIVMWMHDKEVSTIVNEDVCHRLAWSLDACITHNALEDRQVREIQRFFDSVERDDKVYGEIAMILNTPYIQHMLGRHVLSVLGQAARAGKSITNDRSILWASALLNLGSQAHNMLESQVYRIPRLDKEVLFSLYNSVMGSILKDSERPNEPSPPGYPPAEETVFRPSEADVSSLTKNAVARQILYQYLLDRAKVGDLNALEAWLPTLTETVSIFYKGAEETFAVGNYKAKQDPDASDEKSIVNPSPLEFEPQYQQYAREFEVFLKSLTNQLVENPQAVSYILRRSAELSGMASNDTAASADESQTTTVYTPLEKFFDQLMRISQAAHREWVRLISKAQILLNLDLQKNQAKKDAADDGLLPYNLKAIVLLYKWAERSAAYGCFDRNNNDDIVEYYFALEGNSSQKAFNFRIHRDNSVFIARILNAKS